MRFFALLFPGFVATAVYDLRIPAERRKWADMGLALVAYSVGIDAIVAIVLFWWPLPQGDSGRTIFLGVLFDVVAPVLIGWYMVDMREALSRNGFILSSWPKAWDAFYNRFKKTPVALVITLSNGRKVGGFWAEDPIASSFPADEDIFLPAVVEVHQDSGIFVKRNPIALGLLVKRADIVTIEAFDAAQMAALAAVEATHHSPTSPGRRSPCTATVDPTLRRPPHRLEVPSPVRRGRKRDIRDRPPRLRRCRRHRRQTHRPVREGSGIQLS